MMSDLFTRRDFAARLAALLPGLGLGGASVGGARGSQAAVAAGKDDICHAAESIHQEVVFKASRKLVYEALTAAKQFTEVTKFSPVKGAAPAAISPEAGGSFSCFSGHIVGRNVELVPNERVVQAWRVVGWEPGVFSIAEFELEGEGSQTKLLFDHTGFPNGKAEHLAAGWKEHYWEPLEKYLASQGG